jgi:hypothetical protein
MRMRYIWNIFLTMWIRGWWRTYWQCLPSFIYLLRDSLNKELINSMKLASSEDSWEWRIYETISVRYVSEAGEELMGVFPLLYIFVWYLRLWMSRSIITLTVDLYIKEVGSETYSDSWVLLAKQNFIKYEILILILWSRTKWKMVFGN